MLKVRSARGGRPLAPEGPCPPFPVPPAPPPPFARLAHHAEAAGDAEAVVRFALAAAGRAASAGAHREAAAQYARVLRFGDSLPLAQRADLLEQRASECYLTDQSDESIAALQEALARRRELGDGEGEGRVLRQLSECPLVPRAQLRGS